MIESKRQTIEYNKALKELGLSYRQKCDIEFRKLAGFKDLEDKLATEYLELLDRLDKQYPYRERNIKLIKFDNLFFLLIIVASFGLALILDPNAVGWQAFWNGFVVAFILCNCYMLGVLWAATSYYQKLFK